MNAVNNDLRYERKFIVPSLYKVVIPHFIHTSDLRFSRQYPNRTVNSIYFDTSDFKYLKENINGISDRKKFRI